MDTFSQYTLDRIQLFIGRSQTKIRELAKCNAELIIEGSTYNSLHYNSNSIKDLIEVINSLEEVGIIWNEPETNKIIDYYMSEYGLQTKAVSLFTPKFPSVQLLDPTYATSIQLNSESLSRANEDVAINDRIDDIIETLELLDLSAELETALQLYSKTTDLHQHINKSVLDQITQSLIDNVQQFASHISNTQAHITQGERLLWNAKIGPTDSRLTDARVPLAHTHQMQDIVGLIDQVNAIFTQIGNVPSGEDGITPMITIGDVTEGDTSSASIDNTDPANPKLNLVLVRGADFRPDVVGLSADRFDIAYEDDVNGNGLFTYLAEDTGYLYFRNFTFSAVQTQGWSGGLQFLGDRGWSPIIGVHTVNPTMEVLEIVDWIGGQGDKPIFPSINGEVNPRWYIGINGVTIFPELAKNLKGSSGDKGDPGVFIIDVVGSSLAARTAYDGELFGFIFLDDDTGKIYIKESDSNADWSIGYQWRGADGDGGSGGIGSSIIIDIADGGTSKNIRDYAGYEEVDNDDTWIIDGGNSGSLSDDYDILDGGEADSRRGGSGDNQGDPGEDGEDGDKYATTSVSELTIGTGTQNLTTVDTGLAYTIGQAIIIANDEDNFMEGRVISYNSNTGAFSANITDVTGSGTFSAWDVNLSGPVAQDGTLLKGDSSSNITAIAGSKVFTLTPGQNYGFIIDHYIIASANDVATILRGRVTNVIDNVISVQIDNVVGTQSSSDWTVAVSGETGAQGLSIKGDAGDEGLSAYEVWLNDGNSGSVTEFLDSLVGLPGDDGDIGSTTLALSSTSLTFTTGVKNITLIEYDPAFGDNFAFGFGQRVAISFSSTEYMTANVVSYTIATKVLQVNVDTLNGSPGTQSSWTIALIGEKGDDGESIEGDAGTPASISGTSTSNHTASTGSKAFTLPSGFNYGFIPNQRVIISSATNGTILRGSVLSLISLTLTITVDEVVANSGSSSSWNIGVEAPIIAGVDGDDGLDGFVYHAVSSTTITPPSLGSKTFALAAGPNYGFAANQLFIAISSSGIIMYGVITSYTTNSLQVSVELISNPSQSGGSSSWQIALSVMPFLLEGISTNNLGSGDFVVSSTVQITLQPHLIFGFNLNQQVRIVHSSSPDIITNKYIGVITNISGNTFTVLINDEEDAISAGNTTWKMLLESGNSSGGGEANTIGNTGTGVGLANGKSGIELRVKSLLSSDNSILINTNGANEINIRNNEKSQFWHPNPYTTVNVNSASTGIDEIGYGYSSQGGTSIASDVIAPVAGTLNYQVIINIQVQIPSGTALIVAFDIIRANLSLERTIEYRFVRQSSGSSMTITITLVGHAILSTGDGIRTRVFRNGTGIPIVQKREININQARL